MSLAKEVSKGFKSLLKKDTDERKRRLKGNKEKEIQTIQKVVIKIIKAYVAVPKFYTKFYRLIICICGKIYSTRVVSNSFELSGYDILDFTSKYNLFRGYCSSKFSFIYNYYFY